MSGTCYTKRLTQASKFSLKKQCNIDSANQDSINGNATDLLIQIAQAFQKPPNPARILHGDRKIRQGGRGRRTALFPSMKCGGSVPLESRLELAYAVVLERSPSVQEYRTQAIRIRLPKGRYAHPDFLVRMTCGQVEVHEVKPSIAHLPQADVDRFRLIRNVLDQAGVGFRLIDMHSLPSPRILEELLQHYTRGHLQSFSQMQIELARSLLTRHGCNSFDAAYQLMVLHELPAQIIDFLSFHQQWLFYQPATKAPRSRGVR
jgi:hypothetical protein